MGVATFLEKHFKEDGNTYLVLQRVSTAEYFTNRSICKKQLLTTLSQSH